MAGRSGIGTSSTLYSVSFTGSTWFEKDPRWEREDISLLRAASFNSTVAPWLNWTSMSSVVSRLVGGRVRGEFCTVHFRDLLKPNHGNFGSVQLPQPLSKVLYELCSVDLYEKGYKLYII